MSLPIVADVRFGASPRVAGWLLAAWGGGALAGTFVVMPAVKKLTALRLGAIAGIGMAVPLWFLPLGQPAVTIALILVISGIFVPMLNAPGFALLTTRPPAELRGQVITFFVTANLLAGPAAYVAAGPLFTHFGLMRVLAAVAIGVTLCAAVLLTFLRPAVAHGQQPAPVEALTRGT
jgi:predicted MFS family arabinose efflux permease